MKFLYKIQKNLTKWIVEGLLDSIISTHFKINLR